MLSATQARAAAPAPTSLHGPPSSPLSSRRWVAPQRRQRRRSSTAASKISCRVGLGNNGEAGVLTIEPPRREVRDTKPVELKAEVTVHLKDRNRLEQVSFFKWLGNFVSRKWLYVELVSSELDPETKQEWKSDKVEASYVSSSDDHVFIFEARFQVPSSFGPVGAVLLDNDYEHEMFIKDVKVFPTTGDKSSSAVVFHCESWVIDNERKHRGVDDSRVFFPLKSYLPSQTPKGLEGLRRKELEAIRGDGKGVRVKGERIYDYATYDDLGRVGDPRPVLGGSELPYPRRCRTGQTEAASKAKAKDKYVYVPRDEEFAESKALAFKTKAILSGLHSGIRNLVTNLLDQYPNAKRWLFLWEDPDKIEKMMWEEKHRSFPSLAAINAVFEEGFTNVPPPEKGGTWGGFDFNQLRGALTDLITLDLNFETPEILQKDKLAWFRDEEFARETLAGMNPLCIQLVTELPIVSQLSEKEYGVPRKSDITPELIEKQINGVLTADEAVKQKKLFMLDYHDVFLPYVHKVRDLANPKNAKYPEQTTLYGSRTLFFLTDEGTLKPIAIELTRPQNPVTGQPHWRKVFTPDGSVTGSWLWQLAKTHVLAHDTGYHQLISHWLRTHCCVEPYIIAANRQLSQMHPIYRLLHPHFRYTMEINAMARQMLINADGIIEDNFAPKKYCLEMSSKVYGQFWRFDMEALPNDLIRRGMAVQGPDGKLKLTIEDYPYANDGLLVWDAIKEWVSKYVAHYYSTAADIVDDEELQGWWTEVRTEGHKDKKDEPWWPVLDSHDSLIQVLTTIIWVTSAHHAAVNFGQYPFGGYILNRPTIARKNMPTEGRKEDMDEFLKDPEKWLLDTLPSQFQTLNVLTVLDLLSSHSPDEEYMGSHGEPAWIAEDAIDDAFKKFKDKMVAIRELIEDDWNKDPNRLNRCGPGVVPYTLLMPCDGNPFDDERSVMEMGIPNSISI